MRCRHWATAGLSFSQDVWGSRFGSFDFITDAYTVVVPCGALTVSIARCRAACCRVWPAAGSDSSSRFN